MSLSEHDYEPIRGLPALLPAGEILLWQGAPRWWSLARQAFRVNWVAGYFACLALWHGASTWSSTHQGWATAQAVGLSLLLGTCVVALLSLVAWRSARATVYSITNRRVVIRHGISLSLTLNLPFSRIQSADACMRRDGTGDLSCKLHRQQRIGYILNWPHVRPRHLLQPQPTLRAIGSPAVVAEILASALQASLRTPAHAAVVRSLENPGTRSAPASVAA